MEREATVATDSGCESDECEGDLCIIIIVIVVIIIIIIIIIKKLKSYFRKIL